MKNDKGFTTIWVVVNKGDAPRRFSSRGTTRLQKGFEVFGRFRSDDSDRLHTVAEVYTTDPALQAQTPSNASATIVPPPRRRFGVIPGNQPEAALTPD